MDLRFTWDPAKAAANMRKHRISFPEAVTAFGDPLSISVPDPDHSSVGEERGLLIGRTERQRLVVVVHLEGADVIRLISARLATRPERKTYEEEA